ncbi:hypothetical protein [Alkalibacillus almallahensis]|uniref:hypothetical protein n=1 Tax=Alkalibacillus almallahensis TaxID=1379154 RepID=UPI001421403B|nr:hypothetical protein [Alkalibacillus almallahensis]NIK10939.1 hypothetical protein [Alkalibacillus almallahensis]
MFLAGEKIDADTRLTREQRHEWIDYKVDLEYDYNLEELIVNDNIQLNIGTARDTESIYITLDHEELEEQYDSKPYTISIRNHDVKYDFATDLGYEVIWMDEYSDFDEIVEELKNRIAKAETYLIDLESKLED